MNNKKGQAALEFLTTYGWAFLVIIVAVAGLSYFGVFDFSSKIPDSCNTGMMLQCGSSYAISSTDSKVSLSLKNNENQKITIDSIKIREKTLTSTYDCNVLATSITVTGSGASTDSIPAGNTADVVATLPGSDTCGIDANKGNKKTFTIQINYKIGTSTIVSSTTGEISTRVI